MFRGRWSRQPYSRPHGAARRVLVTLTAYLAPVYSSAVSYLKSHRTVISFTLPITGTALPSIVITLTSWVGDMYSSAASFAWATPWLSGVVDKFDALTGNVKKHDSLTGGVRKFDSLKGRRLR